MKTSYFLFIFVLVIATISCSKSRETNEMMKPQTEDIVVNINNNSFLKNIHVTKVHGNIGKYENFFLDADATIGISSSRYYPLGEETVMAFYDPIDAPATKSAVKDDHAYEIQINGRNVFAPSTKAEDNSITSMFGKNVAFAIPGIIPTTKGGESNGVTLYAPEIVRISFPSISSEMNRYPLCYYKEFEVRWNADTANANGVIILIKWDGAMVFGEDYPDSYIYHSTCVSDTGIAVLSESMFDGIPDTAFCSMFVLRGDVENMELDDTNLRVLAETHDVLEFVLIRNVEYGLDSNQ
ncbi:MAG: hypothetical protein IJR01_01330 [Bacteroidales bacterium]|nr:hypothetical protein [Bacteroidales bacterium]